MHLASPLVQCSQTVYGIVASTASDERVCNREVICMRSLITRPLLLGGVYALVALLVVACGGGSGGSSAVSGGTGSVAIAMTDGAAEDFDEINVTVVKIELLSDSGRVTIYAGNKTFNLLDLADKAELFAIRDGVPAGRYSKIRLTLTGIELVKKDADGKVWHMSIFHAFYFVSYMATTIGFGEIPYAFTDAQRLWVALSLYASVVAWIYDFDTIAARGETFVSGNDVDTAPT